VAIRVVRLGRTNGGDKLDEGDTLMGHEFLFKRRQSPLLSEDEQRPHFQQRKQNKQNIQPEYNVCDI
jgi:hypothetical protein